MIEKWITILTTRIPELEKLLDLANEKFKELQATPLSPTYNVTERTNDLYWAAKRVKEMKSLLDLNLQLRDISSGKKSV